MMDDFVEDADLFKESKLAAVDYVIIAGYFISVLAVGIWASRRSQKQSSEENDQVGGYFLASRSMHFIPVGASLFASNIGSEHFIGLAGSGAAAGVAVGNYEVNAIFILMLLGWFFVPVYLASGIYTMPEYLRQRFGGQRIRILLSVLALLAYVLTKISADLYAGALFIKLALGLGGKEGLYLSILILLALAAFFTIFGGLSAVIWTDFIQAVLMVAGALVVMAAAIAKVGSMEKIFDEYSKAVADPEYGAYDSVTNTTCGAIRKDFAHMFRSPVDGDLPWTGTFTGMFLNSIWYWCADQVIVQRTLAAKNLSHAKGGCVLAAFLKLLPLFVLVIPGMAARVIWKNQVGCSNPEKCLEICDSAQGCTNISYVLLVLYLLPIGLRGLMLAVMLAALMSSLTSIFNSASTIFTMDIYKYFRKNASDIELIVVGRCSIVVLVAISIMWIPIILAFKNPQLFDYIQVISSFLQPPITAVFVIALLWHRVTEPAAFYGMLFGFFMGFIRGTLEFSYEAPECGSNLEDTRPAFVKAAVDGIHYLHYGLLAFCVTSVIVVVVSLLTEPFEEDQLHRLTFWSRFSTKVRKPISKRNPKAEVETEANTEQQNNEVPTWRKILFRACLVKDSSSEAGEGAQRKKLTPEEEAEKAVECLQEEDKNRMIVNVLAVTVMSAASFLWGFYA